MVNLSCLHYTVTPTSHVSIMVSVGIKLDHDYSVTRTMEESYISARMRFAELHKKRSPIVVSSARTRSKTRILLA